ncbi:MAG TPA: hypothetical protein VFO76_06975 [Candidatus Kapabacteria bacterium]|nr:hypothetical protein [Candidatus Kapabacteria bacterium]
MKKFSISLFVGVLAAVVAANAPAQMISAQYAKKLVLADASASFVPLTLKAPASLSGAYSLTFPDAAPTANGYLLSASTSGVLSWVDPASYNFLTGVSHNATLTGAGTTGSPLALDLSNANTWIGLQSFQVNSAQGNALVASVNAASNTINAASVGIGLTDAQVNNDLTISGGSITNSPINNSSIGATTASTGRFTTIEGTTLPSSSTSTNIVTSNGGALETRTATDAKVANTIVLRDASNNFAAGTLTLAGITTPATGPGSSLNIQPATATSGASGNINITAGATTSGGGGQVTIQGGNATTSGQGGAVVIQSGSTASGNGNTLSITAGSANASTSGNGGTVGIRGGVSSATSGNGGGVSLTGENAQTSGNGGSITITAGNAAGTNKNGGNVSISVGNSTGSGTQGSVTLTGGNFAFQTAGAQLSFKSSNNTGVSTFQAGAQGTNNFNYSLPTSAPSVGNILTTTAVSGSAITLGWSGTVEITSNSSGTPNANTVYKDNMINAWGQIPANGNTATSSFGIASYTHTNNSGIYVFTLSNPLPNGHGCVIATSQSAAQLVSATITGGGNTVTINTSSNNANGNNTLADVAFFFQVIQGQ